MGFYDLLELSGVLLHGVGLAPTFTYSTCKMRYLDASPPHLVLDAGLNQRWRSAQLPHDLDVAAINEVLDVAQPARVIICL